MKYHENPEPEKLTSPALQFDEIAFLYDELMAGVPYRQWIEYLDRIMQKYDCVPRMILDLCCGTGSVSVRLAEEGYQVSGVDISPEMIQIARQKAEESGIYVDFHVQNAAKLRLGKKFDLVVSLFDSLNYIIDASDLQQAFYRVSEHLEPGGLFVFDMNTELALEIGLFNQNNYGTNMPVHYDWRSTYDKAIRICRIQMEFIYQQREGDKRIEVVHYQRAYGEEEVVEMLQTAGLEVLSVYNAYTLRKASKQNDRVFYVSRK